MARDGVAAVRVVLPALSRQLAVALVGRHHFDQALEAIASAVLEQTSSLAPLLRQRIDTVVREVVTQALAEELQSRQRGGGSGV